MYLMYKKVKKHNERKKRSADHPKRATQDLSQTQTIPSNAGSPTDNPPISEEEKSEKKRRRTYRWKIIFGLFAPFCLEALDTTIIASALPYIAQDFNEVNQLNWIISSFNLTSAAFLFFWAQLTDLFGRHNTLQAAIAVMIIGSAICTGAPTSAFGVLLLGRSLQGVGAGGVNISVRAILADRVNLSEYALNWTVFALVSSIGFSVGPVIGGYLTTASWRWCFAINLPIGVVAMIVVVFVLRKELLGPQQLPELEGWDLSTAPQRFIVRLLTIDYGGQLLFLWGFGLLILGLTWAGGNYAWNSAAVLAPLIIGAVLTCSWVIYERLMVPGSTISRALPRQRAMVPWDLLVQKDIGLLFLINASIGVSMFAVMYFMNLYFALVEGRSSSSAGLSLLWRIHGHVLLKRVASSDTPSTAFRGVTSAVGITVLAWAIHTGKTKTIYAMMALTGHGVGMRMNPASLHGLAYFPQMVAQISCLVSFAVPFGGLVGLTIMSTVFTNKSGPSQVEAQQGIMWAFISMTPPMWLSLVLTTLLGNVWIRKEGSHEVVNGVYLWSLATREPLVREKRREQEYELAQRPGGAVRDEKT
ncbi:hypothetical protein N7539_009254 [Penicillium diatomitis]|uniref:Major facilitator superfamily (MFS) profile domain-containing protein n=1 Tax=Penicillium diatomitis TaxID=2819901 RepID=A0A9W9WLE5_9EURO|nr:uncharacterized protein N7539_009254 [Penicillium diatomitis]KAJ5469636.1 hypothetical protein N7539_009254 [Penicillium diatomitis]